MSAPPKIVELVERFQRNVAAYKHGDYKETRVRVEFVDPFFEVLGWDVRNTRGYAEQYKDVVHEDALKVSGATRAPDYCFRVGGTRKFFLEVKKPAVAIGQDIGPAYQLRRYAWSARLPLSILTDFEEFAVYDCRRKPGQSDRASVARIMYLTADQYLNRWQEIEDVFSREAVLKGSFDSYAQESAGKRGTSEVNAEFLNEINGWREALARNFALRNPALTVHELNFAVQRTIDRIIFLRICEDRGIEHYGRLLALTNGSHIYDRLTDLYRQADPRYNAGLFDLQADNLTASLILDDRVLKPILAGLYYPQSPYEFSVMPADVLGQVYEQFLGKVIRLTAGHQAKVEDKPEVKKAGGVFYTPTFIVDYIVKQTVGRLVEQRTPKQVAQLRILDPACGSGSFLLGAYQYLLDYHLRWYTANDPEAETRRRQPAVYQGPGGEWRLTSSEKKRILINNIFGVDIDRQAVEVTRLSLLLKVLEGETDESIGSQMSLFREAALPDLDNNIKCGNSLIGPEYYRGRLLPDEEEMRRVNPFDWAGEFPAIMAAGGFDVVIGNPPYIRIQVMKEYAPTEVEFYKRAYQAASKGNYDIYVVFVERALQLLGARGRMGFILPHKFFQAKYGQPVREVIAEGRHLAEVVHFGDQQVFAGATTYTCLLFLDKAGSPSFHYTQAHDLNAWRLSGEATEGDIQAGKATGAEWNFVVSAGASLFERLSEMPVKLGDVASNIFQGLVTSADPVYLLEPTGPESHGYVPVKSHSTGKAYMLEGGVVWPLCKGSLDIRRFTAVPSKHVLFPYDAAASASTGRTVLITEQVFRERYKNAWEYLCENYELLRNRERGKMKHGGWYGYVYPKSVSLFARRKLLTPSIASSASFTLDSSGGLHFVGSGGGGGGGYGIILSDETEMEYKYVLGLLNSRLIDDYLKHISTPYRGGYFAYNRQYIERLPIRNIDFNNPADVARHDSVVALVERMLELHKKLAAATMQSDKTLFQRQIEATDRQIDALVYELYELTPAEIKIVEGSG